ncbi:MAG: penicillin-binding transpeptidase domain-containing protein [Pseudomonadota bacterium]
MRDHASESLLMRRLNCFIAAMLIAAPGAILASPQQILSLDDFTSEIGENTVTFIATDLETDATCQLEGSDPQSRHAPWSTFKIPNFLIALETGVVAGPDIMTAWDPNQRPAAHFWPNAWRQEQTLRTAFQASAVWYFQDIALDVGTARYRTILQGWQYGNVDIPDGSDDFWLNNDLQISAQEQVDFLAMLLTDQLSVNDTSLAHLSEASRAWTGGTTTLHGKTGSGPTPSGFEGWYVGWIIRPGSPPTIFALYTTAPRYRDLRDFRQSFAMTLLRRCGFLPDA